MFQLINAVIIVYLILVKCPKSKGLQGQQSSAVYSSVVDLIHCTCRFPEHEHISGAPKIPTQIYYDLSGKVRAVGAEVMKESVYAVAEDEKWVKAEW